MKKIVLLVVLILGVVFSGISQEKQKIKKTKHVCTEMCKDGKHVYKHGEKGHKCTKECHAEKM
jgi:preprotein translocase subunit YajC